MEPPPLAKRTLRPTASLPTTADIYGEKHGIDPNVQLALQNIGRRSRQNISQPSFARTSTAPVVSFNAPTAQIGGVGGGGGGGFQTSHEIMAEARGIVNKEAWRRSTRELQPFGSGSDIDIDVSDQQPGSSQRRSTSTSASASASAFGIAGVKRTTTDDEDQDQDGDDGEGTEVDEDEPVPTFEDEPGTLDDFPPVFQSPHLTQPELFHRPAPFPSGSSGASTTRQGGRVTRGLPHRHTHAQGRGLSGRMLGKTVSAPVGGLWGSAGAAAAGDVDMDAHGTSGDGVAEDGFDISEWAKEEF